MMYYDLCHQFEWLTVTDLLAEWLLRSVSFTLEVRHLKEISMIALICIWLSMVLFLDPETAWSVWDFNGNISHVCRILTSNRLLPLTLKFLRTYHTCPQNIQRSITSDIDAALLNKEIIAT